MSIETYAALDFSPKSALDESLISRADDEQTIDGTINLSDNFTTSPYGATPQMQSWFLECVAPARGQALSELQSYFSSDSYGQGGAKGQMYELEVGRREQARINERRDAIVHFYRGQADTIRERDVARREYEGVRAEEGDREPVAPSPWLYAVGLLVIFIPEVFLNFESLEKLPFIKSPFMATGAALVLALGMGFAAHVNGEILKQWYYWFGPHDRTRVWQAGRLLALAEVALSASLAFVGYARYSYIIPAIQEVVLMGGNPPSVVLSVLFLISSNVIVFLVGVFWSYRNHDLNPEFPKKYRRWQKYAAIFASRFEALKGELGRLDAKCQEQIRTLDRVETAQKGAASYNENRQKLQSILAVDARVHGALQRYRAALVKNLRARGVEPRFVLPIVAEDGSQSKVLSAEEYLAGDEILQLKTIITAS